MDGRGGRDHTTALASPFHVMSFFGKCRNKQRMSNYLRRKMENQKTVNVLMQKDLTEFICDLKESPKSAVSLGIELK